MMRPAMAPFTPSAQPPSSVPTTGFRDKQQWEGSWWSADLMPSCSLHPPGAEATGYADTPQHKLCPPAPWAAGNHMQPTLHSSQQVSRGSVRHEVWFSHRGASAVRKVSTGQAPVERVGASHPKKGDN